MIKRIILILLVVAMLIALRVPAIAQNNTTEDLLVSTATLEYGVYFPLAEAVIFLTDDDFIEAFNLLLAFSRNNPVHTETDLNRIATEFYFQRSYERRNVISGRNFWYDLPFVQARLNPHEIALLNQFPADFAAVASSARIAINRAENRYTTGLHLGNGDAFRHALWNGLLAQRFHALQRGWSLSQILTRTRTWTDAHETGASRPADASVAQFETEQRMDFLNNALGRYFFERLYLANRNNVMEAAIIREIEDSIDRGSGQRIRTDAQLNWTRAQMVNVSTWILRSTNTAGLR